MRQLGDPVLNDGHIAYAPIAVPSITEAIDIAGDPGYGDSSYCVIEKMGVSSPSAALPNRNYGKVICWGYAYDGSFGENIPNPYLRITPGVVADFNGEDNDDKRAVAIYRGPVTTCVRTVSDKILCVGDSQYSVSSFNTNRGTPATGAANVLMGVMYNFYLYFFPDGTVRWQGRAAHYQSGSGTADVYTSGSGSAIETYPF
jgi:hypothetical protein